MRIRRRIPNSIITDTDKHQIEMIGKIDKYCEYPDKYCDYPDIDENKDGINKYYEILITNQTQELLDKKDEKLQSYDEIREHLAQQNTDKRLDEQAFKLCVNDKPELISTLQSIQDDILFYRHSNTLDYIGSNENDKRKILQEVIDMKFRFAELEIKLGEVLQWKKIIKRNAFKG